MARPGRQARLRDAKLRIANACIENIDDSPKRELDRAQIRQLGTCRWVTEHDRLIHSAHKLVLKGPPRRDPREDSQK